MGIKKISRFLRRIANKETPDDKLKNEVRQWRKARGDQTLRLDYPLDDHSLVWDIGGYEGDFANSIFEKYQCQVHIFEPLPQYFEGCVQRFRANPKIRVFNFGLSNKQGFFSISNEKNASSFVASATAVDTQKAELRSAVDVFRDLVVGRLDLLKINIEGGEYDVLPALLDSGLINQITHLQIQFHNFVPDAAAKRDAIRQQLALTHRQTWNYDFVWENWTKIL